MGAARRAGGGVRGDDGPRPPKRAASLASFVPPPASDFAEIAARPLFLPDRRPPPEAEQSKAPPPPPSLTVEGVVIAPGQHYAVIAHGNPPKLESVTEGAMIDGWEVENIARDLVSLRAGSDSMAIPVGKVPPPGQTPSGGAVARRHGFGG